MQPEYSMANLYENMAALISFFPPREVQLAALSIAVLVVWKVGEALVSLYKMLYGT